MLNPIHKLTKVIFFIAIYFGSYALKVNAQSQVPEVLVGEKVPDVTINNIINYKSSSAKISDFKGKLLILDFWATYCAPCVSLFPRTDSLEKLFDGKIQFLSVTTEPEIKVAEFLNRMDKIKHIKPISAVGDTLLRQFFPYSSIPYYVWIDSTGKVIANTSYQAVTKKNIEAVLNGKPTTFEDMKDIRLRKLNIQTSAFLLSNNFQLSDSLMKRDEISRNNILSYSVATKAVDATAGHLNFDMNHFSAVNLTVYFIYEFFYDAGYYNAPVQGAFDSELNHKFEIKDKRILNKIDLMDTTHIKPGTVAMQNWLMGNTVCYEIVYPKGISWKEKMILVKQDLDRYFAKPMGFDTHVEQRIDSNTSVLRVINNGKINADSEEQSEEHHDRYHYLQHNLPVSHLINVLNSYFFQDEKISFIDKTGLDNHVDLDLTCDMTKLSSINEQLFKYGLKFIKEPSKIDVLVFTDARK
jgi:thiol-disulfide isomerase/thioredoxin